MSYDSILFPTFPINSYCLRGIIKKMTEKCFFAILRFLSGIYYLGKNVEHFITYRNNSQLDLILPSYSSRLLTLGPIFFLLLFPLFLRLAVSSCSIVAICCRLSSAKVNSEIEITIQEIYSGVLPHSWRGRGGRRIGQRRKWTVLWFHQRLQWIP